MSMSIDATDGVQYADHERQVIAVNLTLGAGEEADTDTDLDPVGERGIDPDEIAELVSIRRTAVSDGGEFEFDLGLNLGFDEYPTQAASNLQSGNQLEVIDGNPQGQELSNYSEIGALDSGNHCADGQRDEHQFSEYYENLPENYGSGPYVDATDNLSLHVEADNGTGSTRDYRLVYILTWNVEEADDRIPRFSRR